MRGEVYEIEGHRVFTFGGGYSLDKARRQKGISWWPQELPSREEYRNAEEHLRELREQNKPLDFIITHTAPSDSISYLSLFHKFGIQTNISEDRVLITYLDRISSTFIPRKWYFGHYHVDAELWKDQIALLHAVRELESGKIVGWKSPQHDEQE